MEREKKAQCISYFKEDYNSVRKKALYNILIEKEGEKVFFNSREPMNFKEGIFSMVFVSSLML
jgi:hypothetical protein